MTAIEAYIVRFKFVPDCAGYYAAYLDQEDWPDFRPLLNRGKLALFSNRESCTNAIAAHCQRLGLTLQLPDSVPVVCDFPAALSLIGLGQQDEGSLILNCINISGDAVAVLPEWFRSLLPKSHAALSALADHLTFESSFADFLTTTDWTRELLIGELTSIAGALVTNASVDGAMDQLSIGQES